MVEVSKLPEETGAARCDPELRGWRRAEAPDYKGFAYAVDAVLVADEEEGGYVVSIAQLPGVLSQGDNAESAIRNIVEAFRAVIASYLEEGKPIPWRDPLPDKEINEEWLRIVV